MRISPRQNGQEGFSTLELIVSLLLLSMVLGSTIQLLSTSMQLIKRANTLNDQKLLQQSLKAGINRLKFVNENFDNLHEDWQVSVSEVEQSDRQNTMSSQMVLLKIEAISTQKKLTFFKIVKRARN